MFQKESCYVILFMVGCIHQSCLSGGIPDLDICAMLQKQFCDFIPCKVGGMHQSSHPVGVLSIDICAGFQDKLSSILFTGRRCNIKQKEIDEVFRVEIRSLLKIFE